MPKNDEKAKARAEALAKAHEQLKKVRASKTVALKPIARLKDTITGFDGKPQPFKLRYYQVQGAYHLMLMKRLVLGDGTGLGKCVTGDTLISTDQGMLPIIKLAPKVEMEPEHFYAPAFPVKVNLGGRLVPVRQFYWNGDVPTYRARTRDGYTITGSANHPILVRTPDGEVFTKIPDLLEAEHYACVERRGTFATEPPAIPFTPDVGSNALRYGAPPNLTPELARLLGYVVGEGTVTSKYTTVITQHWAVNEEPHEDIRGLLGQVFGWDNRDAKNSHWTDGVNVASLGIRQYLAACGVDYVTARHKTVPWVIQQGTREHVREFLRSMFEGEGSVGSGGIEFSTASERLGQELQLLLLQFGILSVRKPKLVKGYDHIYWRLTIFGDSAARFASQIGFVSSRKQDALVASLPEARNPNKDVVPYARELVERVRSALSEKVTLGGANELRQGSGLKQFGDTFQSKLKHVRSGNRNPTYGFLRELYAACEQVGLLNSPAVQELQGVLQNEYYYDPVVEVTDAGVQPVMDIEVDAPQHAFTANGLVNHNTVETITALAYLWEKEPNNKVIVVAPKSAIRQWASEVKRFTNGVKVILATGSVEDRKTAYEAFRLAPTGPNDPKVILILNYAILIRDWNLDGFIPPPLPNGRPDPKTPVRPGFLDRVTTSIGENLVVVFDEATAFKNMNTKTWEIARFLSDKAHRCYGLTATLLKNNLMEGYCIYKAIKPELFTTKTKFYEDFCFIEMKKVGKARIPLILGYKNLDQFRERIDPFFLGRPRHAVSDELPTLTTREITFEISKAENAKYRESLDGLLELGDGTVKEFEENKALVSLIYCQQVVNSLTQLKFKEGDEILDSFILDDADSHKIGSLSSKEQALVDLLTDELDGEKTIIYTRFASLVPRLQEILKKNGIKSTRITGKENDKARSKNQAAFQDLESDTLVIFVTAAGTEAINLQAAAAMIFFDAPWSWGDYVQALGRMIRIGSPHPSVVAYHLIAERPADDRKTIDHHVLRLLRKKKGLIDKVLGESAVGALKFEKEDKGSVLDLLRAMQGKGGVE